jgi:predicted acylesterase/phospholipase RssA
MLRMCSLRPVVSVVAALALTACANINPPRIEKPSVFLPWGALRQDSSQTVAFNPADLPPGVVMDDHTGDDQITVLALSGGGSYGPFGAGVLAGWTETGERPEPDVVTGVSAGSLLSTFAFLGPAFDTQTREIYASITNSNIYEKRDLITVPFSSSMVKQSPLRALLESVLTDDILDRVARERRERGRRLLVASTDLDNGRVVIFDLTSIAASGRSDRRKIYVDALMASAAIPGFFQPVLISPEPDSPDQRQQLHVDGSVSTSVFLPPFTDINRSLPIKVYAIINSKMMEEPSADVLRVNALDISAASLQKVLRTVLQRSVYDMFLATTLAGGDFYLLGIPENIVIDTPQYEFTPELTQALYTLGQTLGRNQSWRNEPPRFDSLTTQINIDEIRALTRR